MNVYAYNKFMTGEYYETLSIVSKLQLTHPKDRQQLAQEAVAEGAMTKEQRMQVPVGKGWEDLIK